MMQTQFAKKETFEKREENIAFQFRVFKDQEYVRLNGFTQSKITIGRNPNADLVLDHRSVEEFHADVAIKEGLFFLTNYKPNNGLRVNGRSAKKIQLNDSDVIDIGPFSIVFKSAGPETTKAKKTDKATARKNRSGPSDINAESAVTPDVDWYDDSYTVVLDNDYDDPSVQKKVAERLGVLFKKAPEKILPLLSRPGQIIKKDVSYENAHRLQQLLEMAGAACKLKPVEEPQDEPLETATAPEKEIAPAARQARPAFDPEEDDDEDLAADFNLKDRLDVSTAEIARAKRLGGRPQLEVIKCIKSRVVDIRYIGRGRRYRVDGEKIRLRLAELSGKNHGHVSFPESWQGHLISNEKKASLEDYKTEDYLHRKRARLYRMPISLGDTVVVKDGDCEYQVRHTLSSESPTVVHQAREKEITWRHWSTSAGFHLVFLLIACIIFAISSRTPEEQSLHFVKIDMSQFEQQPLPQPEVKKPPKEEVPVQKAEPPKVEPAKIEPAKKAPEVKKKAAPTKTAKATPKAAPNVSGGSKNAGTNSHPDAGGGFGEGNIVNRNINQTGLLSLLGDGATAGSSSSEAVIAEVTNLDAVEVPGASSKQFSVGGIKGSLGNGKISLASGEAVQTKGGQQVLRSVGASGPGTVAALEKGEIGNKQVRGMVTAKMTKTVSIQGGMSREMVKRVIDQHLDEIQYCYESALLENSAIMGRIVYEWKILMSGEVGEVRIVSSSVNSHLIHDCIKEAIKTWQFPKPVGSEVIVSYPFVFDLVGF